MTDAASLFMSFLAFSKFTTINNGHIKRMDISKELKRGFQSSHQVDKVLVADLAISVAIG